MGVHCKILSIFWMFECFCNKMFEKEVKAEWGAKIKMSESGLLLCVLRWLSPGSPITTSAPTSYPLK